MKFLEYEAQIFWNEEDDRFDAIAIGVPGISFSGRSVEELRRNFGTAIEDYLAAQRSRGFGEGGPRET